MIFFLEVNDDVFFWVVLVNGIVCIVFWYYIVLMFFIGDKFEEKYFSNNVCKYRFIVLFFKGVDLFKKGYILNF